MDPFCTLALTGPVPPPTASTLTAIKGGTAPRWGETLCGAAGLRGSAFRFGAGSA